MVEKEFTIKIGSWSNCYPAEYDPLEATVELSGLSYSFSWWVETLTHEIIHHVLHYRINDTASEKFDSLRCLG